MYIISQTYNFVKYLLQKSEYFFENSGCDMHSSEYTVLVCIAAYLSFILYYHHFPTLTPIFQSPPTAIFDYSFFFDFTLLFPMSFNPPTEKSEKAVSRTLNRVLDLVVKNQSVQIGCQMCRVCLLGFHLFPHTEKRVYVGIYPKKSSADFPHKYAISRFFS